MIPNVIFIGISKNPTKMLAVQVAESPIIYKCPFRSQTCKQKEFDLHCVKKQSSKISSIVSVELIFVSKECTVGSLFAQLGVYFKVSTKG